MRIISFLHVDYTLAENDDAELISNLSMEMVMFFCLLFTMRVLATLDLQPEDIVISSDTSIKEFNP